MIPTTKRPRDREYSLPRGRSCETQKSLAELLLCLLHELVGLLLGLLRLLLPLALLPPGRGGVELLEGLLQGVNRVLRLVLGLAGCLVRLALALELLPLGGA